MTHGPRALRACVDCGQFKPHGGRGLCLACYKRHSRAGTVTERPGVNRQTQTYECHVCGVEFEAAYRSKYCPAHRTGTHKAPVATQRAKTASPLRGSDDGYVIEFDLLSTTGMCTEYEHRRAQLVMADTAARLGDIGSLPEIVAMLAVAS